MGLEEHWAVTFASGRKLSDDEMGEIAGKAGYAVALVVKSEAMQRWEYRLYANEEHLLSEEGLQFLRERGVTPFLSNLKYKGLVEKVFPDKDQRLAEFSRNP